MEEKLRQIWEEKRRGQEESTEEELTPGPDQGNQPGQGNILPKRAYQETLPKGSIAPCMADLGGGGDIKKEDIIGMKRRRLEELEWEESARKKTRNKEEQGLIKGKTF